jgi:hypothetical protein
LFDSRFETIRIDEEELYARHTPVLKEISPEQMKCGLPGGVKIDSNKVGSGGLPPGWREFGRKGVGNVTFMGIGIGGEAEKLSAMDVTIGNGVVAVVGETFKQIKNCSAIVNLGKVPSLAVFCCY